MKTIKLLFGILAISWTAVSRLLGLDVWQNLGAACDVGRVARLARERRKPHAALHSRATARYVAPNALRQQHDTARIAACKFKEGDRVRMTKRARKMFYAHPSEVGEVVGTYPCGATVWFHGKGVRHSFHQDFLEKVEGRHGGGKIRHQTSCRPPC